MATTLDVEKEEAKVEAKVEAAQELAHTIALMWERRRLSLEAGYAANDAFRLFIEARLCALVPTAVWVARADEIRPGEDNVWLTCKLAASDSSELAAVAHYLSLYQKKVFVFDAVEIEAWHDSSSDTICMCVHIGPLSDAVALTKRYALNVDWSGLEPVLYKLESKAQAWMALLGQVQSLVWGGADAKPVLYESEVLP